MNAYQPSLTPDRPLRARWLPARLLGLAVIVFASTIICAPSRADTTSLSGATEITSLPYPINTPGVYFLSRSFVLTTTDVSAITVNASGVTIDFNGHTISNVPAGTGVDANGIYSANSTRLTVRNGTIRGFTFGVNLNNTSDYGVLIENMRFLDCTYAGIDLWASGSIIRHCQMSRIGGSTYPQWPNGFGIIIVGTNDNVEDCDIGTLLANTGYQTIGIYVDQGGSGLLVNNRISGTQNGVYIDSSASGKFRDNLCAASVTTPYTGGTDAGNN